MRFRLYVCPCPIMRQYVRVRGHMFSPVRLEPLSLGKGGGGVMEKILTPKKLRRRKAVL